MIVNNENREFGQQSRKLIFHILKTPNLPKVPRIQFTELEKDPKINN